MADALVRYGDTRVVLRHQNSVVLYDSNSRRLIVRNLDGAVDSTACPHCGRSYHESHTYRDGSYQEGVASNLDHNGTGRPEYFRMLQQSLPEAVPSAPPSPIKQLVEPLIPQQPGVETEPEPETAAGISKDALSPGYFSRFFREEGELGRGGKGIVLQVSHVLDGVPLGLYACKRIPVGNDHKWLVKILAEVQLLSNLAHENLVQYKHVWLEEVKLANFGPSVPCAFILQQICNGGDLQKHICGHKPAISPAEELKARHRRKSKVGAELHEETRIRLLKLDEIYSFFKQITAGINYLHVNNYVHRDLKPSNCLLHDTGSELRVLVSDFGEVQKGDQIREGTGATGTISYCAPEVLKLDESTGHLGEFTTKSDVFSLGMVLHFLCFGQLPYRSADGINEEDEDVEQLKDEISRWAGFEQERNMRSDLPDELYQSLSHLLSTKPSHRPSALDILSGLESLGGPTPSANQPHHMRTQSSERVFDRRSSRVSRMESQSPRTTSTAISQAPPVIRHMSPPISFDRDDTAVETEDDEPGQSDSLVLRSPPASRAVSPLKEELKAFAPPPPRPSPKLLPAASEAEEVAPRTRRYVSDQQGRLIESVVLGMKLLSLYVPCLPSAVRPIIAGPLLVLAVADYIAPGRSFLSSIALAVIHGVVLAIVLVRQSLCYEPRLAWSEDFGHGEL